MMTKVRAGRFEWLPPLIGAVIGAGGGYVVGRKMDKKDGRY